MVQNTKNAGHEGATTRLTDPRHSPAGASKARTGLAERQKRFRERQKRGDRIFQMMLSADTILRLVELGYIPRQKREDLHAIVAGFSRFAGDSLARCQPKQCHGNASGSHPASEMAATPEQQQ